MAGAVLIVDDDANTRSTLASGLEFRGFRVLNAANGLDALRLVEAELPALVLLDVEMPVLDGHGFARELARRGIRLPIIVMSGSANAAAIAEQIGAVACLVKPFDVRRLFASIDAVLNSTS
jgi:two-component system, chemotaxis family, chemotaxis protein CheY